MAIGLSPKHEQSIDLSGLCNEEFIVIALDAASSLGWNAGFISRQGFVAYTEVSMSSYGEELKVTLQGPSALVKSQCTTGQFFDWGKNKRNVRSFIGAFDKIRAGYSKEALAGKIAAMQDKLAPGNDDLQSQSPLSTKENLGGFLSIFKPVKGFFITPILLNLNLAVFILMVVTGVSAFMPENEQLLAWGANFRPATLDGQWWRLLTCCFVHIGVFHLLMNMYALLYIGVLLEPLLGRARFLSAYIVTGIAASLASLFFHKLTISAGASGAIFGMYGVFLAMLTTNHIEKSARKSLLTSIAIFVGYNLMNGMKSGIDNAAHIGGLVSGMAIGYVFLPSLKQGASRRIKHLGIGLISAAIAVITVLACLNLSNDTKAYEAMEKEFSAYENKALEVYHLPENTPNDRAMGAITEGIKDWKKCQAVALNMQKLDLPVEYQQRNGLLDNYCKLRIESYELLLKSIMDNDTEQYRAGMDTCNAKIDRVLKAIAGQ